MWDVILQVISDKSIKQEADMKSNALTNFESRLKEIDQLLDAHSALTSLRRATKTAESGGDLASIGLIVQQLVTDPGRGRPKEVHALNSGAIALLSAHLQGYIVDVFTEAAQAVLKDRLDDLNAFVSAAPTQGNPNEDNIRKLFRLLGFKDILQDISWQKMSNDSLRKKLKAFNQLRNRLVHGSNETVQKRSVTNYKNAWSILAVKLDGKLRTRIKRSIGSYPW